MAQQGEITITLTTVTGQITESIQVSQSSTSLSELCEFAVALLGLPSSQNIILLKNGQRLYENTSSDNAASSRGNRPLSSVGIQNGDVIVAITNLQERDRRQVSGSGTAATPMSSAPLSAGGLDFSSLLRGTGDSSSSALPSLAAPSSRSSATVAAAAAASSGGGSGGLLFQLPPAHLPMFQQTHPIQWNGMTLDDCIERNPNPSCFVQVLLSPNHPNLWKELNHHSPALANKLKNAKSLEEATNIWRDQMQKSTMSSTLSRAMINQKDKEMEQRLRINPLDEEANKYFGEKIRKENVERQYRQMMEEFPESMGRVLMLYIDTEVNGHPVQAFVDSGAQNSIMSSACAERCGLLHLLDTRFSGIAVGVGTGKILGRVHIAEMKVKGILHIFPCTITIMDEGLGDKNMDFLLGLDMLKRHRCSINLDKSVLEFRVGKEVLETPFLHEKDLSEARGGTLGFNVEKNNQEIEKMLDGEDE